MQKERKEISKHFNLMSESDKTKRKECLHTVRSTIVVVTEFQKASTRPTTEFASLHFTQ